MLPTMVLSPFSRACLFWAIALLSCMMVVHPSITVLAAPIGIVKRGFNGMGIPSLVIAVLGFLQTEDAYSPSTPDKCVITLETTNGGNCRTWVNCEESDYLGDDLGPWNVCYVGGRQYFTHPLVGDFSVMFSKAGGVNGDTTDGLHSPVLQLADYNNWEPFVLDDIIAQEKGASHGRLCGTGKQPGGVIDWQCGVPKKGAHAAFGMSLIDPDAEKEGYTPGWCTAHVNQYQKNEFGVGDRYAFDVIIYDADGKQIGHAQKAAVDANGFLSIDSRLPYTLDISVESVDSDPVTFAYEGQLWVCDGNDKSAHDCTLGKGPNNGYEAGNREGDMGFTCGAAPDGGSGSPPSTSSINGMFVGDSITHGADGDFTWRYRLWQWLDSEGVDTNFVGPFEGTFPAASPASAKPTPPPLAGEGPIPTVDLSSGRYAGDVEARFPRSHASMWGRQAAQVIDTIGGYVQAYEPDYIFLMLGFNDLGWFVSGPEGTLQSVEKVVRNAQAARPSVKILVGNVVQRTLIKVVNEQLPEKTTDYNQLLKNAIGGWSTSTSTVKLVDIQSNYNCNPDACADGYDGLHPNALGEFHIAQSFADVLRIQFGVGKNPFAVGPVPPRVANTPSNLKAQAVPAGIQVTWNPEIGARGYDLRSRRVGGDWGQRSVNTNAYWETWVYDNDSWEYQVRTSMGDDNKSGWTDTVSATAHPQTAPGPQNIKGTSTGSGISATWDAVNGYNVIEYALILYDEDEPGAIINSVGSTSTSATISGLTPGHKYVVAVATWTDVGGGFPNTGPDVTV